MNTLHTKTLDVAGLRIDGVDMGELLRAIGEASAKDSAADLFGLLLSAQRVLAYAPKPSANLLAAQEASLIASLRGMNDDGRDRLCSLAKRMLERFPRQRAALTLVPSSRNGRVQ